MKPINSRAVVLIRYGVRRIKWTIDELRTRQEDNKNNDTAQSIRKTTKTMTHHRAFHRQTDVDSLYIPTKNGERGMISVEDCAEAETRCLKKYAKSSNEKLINTVEGEGILESRKRRKEVLEAKNKNFIKR